MMLYTPLAHWLTEIDHLPYVVLFYNNDSAEEEARCRRKKEAGKS